LHGQARAALRLLTPRMQPAPKQIRGEVAESHRQEHEQNRIDSQRPSHAGGIYAPARCRARQLDSIQPVWEGLDTPDLLCADSRQHPRIAISGPMLDENLTPDERGELLKLLRDTIAADRYPLSRRIRTLKSVLAKLDPQPQPVVEPLPPRLPM